MFNTDYNHAVQLAKKAVDYIDAYDLWDAYGGTPEDAEGEAIAENASLLFSGDDGGILDLLRELLEDSDDPEESAKIMSLANEIEAYTEARRLSA